MSEKILYIVRGLPGSGKSTLAKELTENVVEADQFLYENGEYIWTPERCMNAHKMCQETVRQYMAEGLDKIAVANTFVRFRDMNPYKALANEYGYKVIVENRSENKYIDFLNGLSGKDSYESIHDVSDDTLDRMRRRFQISSEPLVFESYGVNGDSTLVSNKRLERLYNTGDKSVKKYEGTFQKPYYMTADEYRNGELVEQWFIDNGYDGIVYHNGDTTKYIVLNESCVKLYEEEESNETLVYNDLVHGSSGNKFEKLRIYKNPSEEWLKRKITEKKSQGLCFLHNVSENELYVWDSKINLTFKEVFMNYRFNWDSETVLVGVLEPTGVSVSETYSETVDEDVATVAKKVDGKLFRTLYGNGYYVTTFE